MSNTNKQFNLWITPELIKKIKCMAAEKEINCSQLITEALNLYFENNKFKLNH
jgi:predicted HicB family RNase H-like nuclease